MRKVKQQSRQNCPIWKVQPGAVGAFRVQSSEFRTLMRPGGFPNREGEKWENGKNGKKEKGIYSRR
jgi:hypothetical protein